MLFLREILKHLTEYKTQWVEYPYQIPNKSTRYKNNTIEYIENKIPLPELYQKRESCCGCTACYAICSSNAITMEPDEEGFLYPVVDARKCVRCYKCLSVCAFKEAQKKKGYL
ncbi:4Fe-4S dicluster domain-containing protein [Hydrogenispora ethanolica]|uniref:4Fe-4S dicluster domain-containing protein n=1 Tax=Hydrogenispora ethanolica TaxID=1082276 RepID=UPI00104E2321|nr:4Fe-4S dicluster domain-containing protein [Hydrogenispora ethanolica]